MGLRSRLLSSMAQICRKLADTYRLAVRYKIYSNHLKVILKYLLTLVCMDEPNDYENIKSRFEGGIYSCSSARFDQRLFLTSFHT
jgi:hypothetical protein